MKVTTICKKCGKSTEVDTSVVLTSLPPQYRVKCKHCGEQYSCFTSEVSYVPTKVSEINQIKPKLYQINIYKDLKKFGDCSMSELFSVQFTRDEELVKNLKKAILEDDLSVSINEIEVEK